MKYKLFTIEKMLILVVMGSSLLVPFSRDLVVAAVPYMKVSLVMSTMTSSLLIGAYSFGRGAGQLVSGKATDNYGPDRLFGWGSLVLVLASLLSFFAARNVYLLIGFHFLQGAGVSTQILTSRVILQRLSLDDPAKLAKLFSGKKLAAFIFGTFAPLVTVFMILNFGWRSLYLLTAFLGTSFAGLVFLLTRSSSSFGKLETAQDKLSYRLLFANRGFLFLCLLGMAAYLWTHTYFVGFPFVLRTLFQVDSYSYGFLLSLNMVAACCGAIFNIFALSYLPPRKILLGSTSLLASLLVLHFVSVVFSFSSLLIFVASFALMSACIPCITANSMSLALQEIPPAFAGRATAVFGFCQFASGLLGSLIAGFALSRAQDPALGLAIWLGGIALLKLLLVYKLKQI